MSNPFLNIAAVERDVGLSKDVLRVWERRYGFPTPKRDAHGERLYAIDQVERLRLIKRLMDQGLRPGRLMASSNEELSELVGARLGASPAEAPGNLEVLTELTALIQQHDTTGYSQALHQHLARSGLQRFVLDTMAPLVQMIGGAWEDGRIEVFEEHLFTELSSRVLRQAIPAVAGGPSPRVLLTTLPEESHSLGLLMVECILSIEGAHCIPLGTQVPMLSVVDAARAHRADVVALSFSAAFPSRQILPLLEQLQGLLPQTVSLWAGGRGVHRLTAPKGVHCFTGLEDIAGALERWRQPGL